MSAAALLQTPQKNHCHMFNKIRRNTSLGSAGGGTRRLLIEGNENSRISSLNFDLHKQGLRLAFHDNLNIIPAYTKGNVRDYEWPCKRVERQHGQGIPHWKGTRQCCLGAHHHTSKTPVVITPSLSTAPCASL